MPHVIGVIVARSWAPPKISGACPRIARLTLTPTPPSSAFASATSTSRARRSAAASIVPHSPHINLRIALSMNVSSALPFVKSATRASPPTCPGAVRNVRNYSSLPRPYRFHVGASWAGKPHDPRGPRVKTSPFPADSPIGKWRDTILSRPNAPAGTHIGEDFFYVQDVSIYVHARHLRILNTGVQMREKSVS